MAFWIARHAKSLIAQGICYGALDMPADEEHTQQSAAELHRVLPPSATVVCSPLLRCRQLAASLQSLRPEVSIQLDASLAEMNFGVWEGTPWSEIPQEAFDAWTADFGNHAFGGVESVNAMLARLLPVFKRSQQSPQSLVWITHAGVARAATLLNAGVISLSQPNQWPTQGLTFGEVTLLR